MRLAALLLLALSAGCGDEPRAVVNAAGIEREAEVVRAPITMEPAKSDDERDRSTAVAPPAKPLVSRGTSARDPAPPDYRAIGTEPFWAVTVRGATAVLERFGLADKADVSVHSLSGGQRQLLALAGVLATDPDVLVADEPTTLLDLANTRRIGDLLLGLGQQLVLVTHDLDLARRCDRVLVVEDARVVHDGPAEAAVAAYEASVLG